MTRSLRIVLPYVEKEAIYHHLYETPEDLSATMDAYMRSYNERRPHRALTMLTPAEKEREFCHMPK
jgi:transposase InsO family protein